MTISPLAQDTRPMIDMPQAADTYTKIDILERNIRELQEQLHNSYVRIAELNEEILQLKAPQINKK
jgi:predicted RNase H-like nuclease (RuvC/YqgF family)